VGGVARLQLADGGGCHPVVQFDALGGGVCSLVGRDVAVAGVDAVVVAFGNFAGGLEHYEGDHQWFLIAAVEFCHGAENGADVAAPESGWGVSGGGGCDAVPEFAVGAGRAVARGVHEDRAGGLGPCVDDGGGGVVLHFFSCGWWVIFLPFIASHL